MFLNSSTLAGRCAFQMAKTCRIWYDTCPIEHKSKECNLVTIELAFVASFKCRSYSSIVILLIRMSSGIFLITCIPWWTLRFVSWNISDAVETPKFRRFYLNILTCVVIVVIERLDGSNSNWWYPCRRSNIENTAIAFKSWISSSIVGIRWRSLIMAS